MAGNLIEQAAQRVYTTRRSIIIWPNFFSLKRQATVVILLCAGSKRTQMADIKRAKKYWEDYQQRIAKSKEQQ